MRSTDTEHHAAIGTFLVAFYAADIYLTHYSKLHTTSHDTVATFQLQLASDVLANCMDSDQIETTTI